jgi:aryl-alcohol dehydrogenase-like predicted oxidoreductase
LGTTTWSPLGGGILSGKFNDGNVPDNSRYANDFLSKNVVLDWYFSPSKRDHTIAAL